MPFSAYLNDIPKPAWIVATVLAFVFFWPLGIALIGYLVGSGRIGGRWLQNGPGQWHNAEAQPQKGSCWGKWGSWQQQRPPAPPSGNAAFDEYRTEALRRLEEEQKEFVEYLERLRRAKDKAEFDQFMADRRRPMTAPDAQSGA